MAFATRNHKEHLCPGLLSDLSFVQTKDNHRPRANNPLTLLEHAFLLFRWCICFQSPHCHAKAAFVSVEKVMIFRSRVG